MYWLKVGAQTETELKEKKLRVEDALNATKVIFYCWGLKSILVNYTDMIDICQAAVEEGIVVGGGCTLLRLASKVDAIKAALENDEEKVNSSKLSVSY